METLRQRARLIGRIRHFFQEREVWEVTTPVLMSAIAPERHQDPLQTQTGYLQTSPETAMKRLIAAGSGAIFQIGPAFRADERGALHNPEFTMLEWYRPGWSMARLMDEVAQLVQSMLGGARPVTSTFQQAFLTHVGVDPFDDSLARLEAAAFSAPPRGLDRGGLVDWLLVDRLEPALKKQGGSHFIRNYPAWDPAMAEVDPGPPAVARRFELYIDGVEVANGYQELTDVGEQTRRLAEANRLRGEDGRRPLPIDDRFLAAMAHGFPRCAGVAMGLDRLIMAALGKENIADVMAFPVERA